jgi:hypothetical protein
MGRSYSGVWSKRDIGVVWCQRPALAPLGGALRRVILGMQSERGMYQRRALLREALSTRVLLVNPCSLHGWRGFEDPRSQVASAIFFRSFFPLASFPAFSIVLGLCTSKYYNAVHYMI